MARKEIYRRIHFRDEDLKKAVLCWLKTKDHPSPEDGAVTLSWLPDKEGDGYILEWQVIEDVK